MSLQIVNQPLAGRPFATAIAWNPLTGDYRVEIAGKSPNATPAEFAGFVSTEASAAIAKRGGPDRAGILPTVDANGRPLPTLTGGSPCYAGHGPTFVLAVNACLLSYASAGAGLSYLDNEVLCALEGIYMAFEAAAGRSLIGGGGGVLDLPTYAQPRW